MARTHGDRHKWKRKERQRTGEDDPRQIRLHRKRFLKRIEDQLYTFDGYQRTVFHTRLRFNVRGFETSVVVRGEVVGKVPYLVERVEDIHHFIARAGELDVQKEEEALAEHVSRVKAKHEKCHLEQNNGGGFHYCQSAFSCRFRHWDEERNLPECRK